MSLTYTIEKPTVFGDKRVVFGSYNNTGAAKQVDTLTIGGTFEVDDVFTVTVDATPVAHTVVGGDTNNEGIIDALVIAINADVTVGPLVAALKVDATTFTLTAATAGTAFVASSTAVDGGAGTDDQTLVTEITTPNSEDSTGGDIVTGLVSVDNFKIQATGSVVLTNSSVVNETFPLASGDVTIVTDADADGIFMAIGL